MHDDPARLVQTLRDAYALGLLTATEYQHKLEELRARLGAAVVEVLLGSPPPAAGRSHSQIVTGAAELAVAGDVHQLFLAGQHTKSHAQLLHAYLGRLRARCNALPLLGLREQRAADDLPAVRLDQVYTQLATTTTVVREVFDGPRLRSFDAAAYHAAHVAQDLLPVDQRLMLHWVAAGDRSGVQHTRDLASLRDSRFVQQLQRAAQLRFWGPQLVTEALAAHPRLVLLGEPGSGKSTALRYLALALAALASTPASEQNQLPGWDARSAAGQLIPLYVPLLPFARFVQEHPTEQPADALWNHLAAQLEGQGRYAGLAAAIHTVLEQGQAVALFDGLDEVAGAASRMAVVRAVQAFAAVYPACHVVVACRVRAYTGDHNARWQLPGWPTATLAGWTASQMHHFVTAWYNAATADKSGAWRTDRLQQLRGALARRSDLQTLGGSPLLLTMLTLVHLNDGRLPEDRVTLYGRCVELLLGQWELARAEGSAFGTLMDYLGLPDHPVTVLRAVLEEAAFRAHAAATPGSLGTLGRAELRELVGEELRRLGHPDPWNGSERFLHYTDVRAGLLQASDAGDHYGFPHQTFQEYLAGLRLASGVGAVERILARRHEDRWRVPLLLGVGYHISAQLLELPYRLLQALRVPAGKTPERHQRDLLLAAEIGADVGWDRLEQGDTLFSELRQQLAQGLAQVVEGSLLPAAERVRAGRMLGELGDARPGVCTLPPAMVELAGGAFTFGVATMLDDQDDAHNSQPMQLASFAIGRYPITNAQYAHFIADHGYAAQQPWWDAAGRAWLSQTKRAAPVGWQHDTAGRKRPNHPVVGITWHEAIAFCAWLTQHPAHNPQGYHYRLPTEAEWEYAARGGTRRRYPWGDLAPDTERANYGSYFDGPTTVGAFAPGMTPEGVHDLAGNVWEWTSSRYELDFAMAPLAGEPVADPSQIYYTLRGGGWGHRTRHLRAARRSFLSPARYNDNIGMRLIRHIPQEGATLWTRS